MSEETSKADKKERKKRNYLRTLEKMTPKNITSIKLMQGEEEKVKWKEYLN